MVAAVSTKLPVGQNASGGLESRREAFAASLLQRGKLTDAALDRARRLARENDERLETVLTRLGLISEQELTERLAAFLDLPVATAADFPVTPVLVGRLGLNFLRQRQIVPLAERPDGVVVAMSDPLDAYAVEAVGFASGKAVIPKVAAPSDIEAALERMYGSGHSSIRQALDLAAQRPSHSADDDIERLKDSVSEAPVIRLVNALIADAVEARASDIHVEPTENELRVRFRVDGVLQQVISPPAQLAPAVLSRIKVMAKLNIAERRLPQDGRMGIAVRGRDVDIRVAISPTIRGERATLRILDRSDLKLDFAELGFDESVCTPLREVLSKPYGIFLVTGPTGSGKTTTLYAALSELNRIDTNILTVEDPVEYLLPGINQVQVKPQIGLTFAAALRSFLRQDPDIMMVGEIRDLETAQIAVQAALTGHLILSTVHTNDAASTITRLLDMGVEDYLITSTMNGVVAQRLVRTLCSSCREPYEPIPDLLRRLELPGTEGKTLTLYRAQGCSECGHTGYRGRSAIMEVLAMSDTVRQAVLRNCDATVIRALAVENGMRSMRDHGLKKALDGQTTVEEVLRVTRAV
jgi:general secretion pathway protein E